LFSSGHYTDYGVALSAGTAQAAESTLQTLDPAATDLSTATDLHPPSPTVVQSNLDPQHEIVGSLGTTALHVSDTIL
jgi:hypothetical protein